MSSSGFGGVNVGQPALGAVKPVGFHRLLNGSKLLVAAAAPAPGVAAVTSLPGRPAVRLVSTGVKVAGLLQIEPTLFHPLGLLFDVRRLAGLSAGSHGSLEMTLLAPPVHPVLPVVGASQKAFSCGNTESKNGHFSPETHTHGYN